MDVDTFKLLLLYGVLPLIGGIGALFVKTVLSRIEALEKEMPHKYNDGEVRQLLDDKISPIREDIADLKLKIDRIIEFLIKDK